MGGILPVALVGFPLLVGKGKDPNFPNIIFPIQSLISQSSFSGLFLISSVVFFLANYKVILYVIETFKKAPLPPKEFFNKILLSVSVGASFCLLGLAMLDFAHFTLLNTIFHAFFFILLNVFYLLIDISNSWAYYTPSNIYWFFDLFLSFSSIIYLIFNQYSLSCTHISIMNTAAVFGYILTPLMFIRYFLLFFEVKERIIEFEEEGSDDEEEDY